MINFVGHRKLFYAISIIFVIISAIAVILWGLEFGIDFKGGAILEVAYVPGERPEVNSIYDSLKDLKLSELRISPVGSNELTLRFRETGEEIHQKVISALNPAEIKGGEATIKIKAEERRFSSIGPTIGAELKQKSLQAIIVVLLGISIYIAWAFRKVSLPVSSWKYGVATLVALFHDIAIPIGLFAFLGRYYGIEVGTNFIVALLVVMGFSVHDTIVVFDRIRENLKRYSNMDFAALINQSLNETMVRSINTSLTVILTLLALFFLGGESLKYFIMALLVGIFSGTYSSIFIAAPLLLTWFNFVERKRAA